MNRFKFGFAAIIALLVMSFTIASNKGAFKNLNKSPKKFITCASTDFQNALDVSTNITYSSGVQACGAPPSGDCYSFSTSASGLVCGGSTTVCCFSKGTSVGCTSPNTKIIVHCLD